MSSEKGRKIINEMQRIARIYGKSFMKKSDFKSPCGSGKKYKQCCGRK